MHQLRALGGSGETAKRQGKGGRRVGLQEMASFAEHQAEEVVRQGGASHASQDGCVVLAIG